MICLYGESQRELKIWRPSDDNQRESLQVVRLLDQYTKQTTALKNKIRTRSMGRKFLENQVK